MKIFTCKDMWMLRGWLDPKMLGTENFNIDFPTWRIWPCSLFVSTRIYHVKVVFQWSTWLLARVSPVSWKEGTTCLVSITLFTHRNPPVLFSFFFSLLFFFTFYRTWYHHKRWTPKFLYLNITYEVAEDPNSCSKQLIDRKRSSYYCQQAHFEGLLFFLFFLWVLYPFFPHLCGGITSVKEYILSGFDVYYTHFSTFVQRKKLDWFLKYQLLF